MERNQEEWQSVEWQQWRLEECRGGSTGKIQQFCGRKNDLILHSSPMVEDVFKGISRLMVLESGILLVTRAVLRIGGGGGGERILKVDYSAAEYLPI